MGLPRQNQLDIVYEAHYDSKRVDTQDIFAKPCKRKTTCLSSKIEEVDFLLAIMKFLYVEKALENLML